MEIVASAIEGMNTTVSSPHRSEWNPTSFRSGTDASSPIECIVHHDAGLDGVGGSSYLGMS